MAERETVPGPSGQIVLTEPASLTTSRDLLGQEAEEEVSRRPGRLRCRLL